MDRVLGRTTRRSARDILRGPLGPAARRLRRELQWRTPGVRFCVRRADPSGFAYVAAEHATPLMRPLSGVDPRLQRNKAVNLRIAAACLDGLVLEPGVRLSFWREVGRPTYRRGFLDGLVLSHGHLAEGVGGGLCQMTNLLYWMTLHTPLIVVERWRHSYDVFPDADRTQPFGSGATCAWPALDLQIENPTAEPYLLSVRLSPTHLTGAWRTTTAPATRYRIEERAHVVTHDGPGTFVRHNELWRLEFSADGALLGERLVATNDALMMYEPFLPPAAVP